VSPALRSHGAPIHADVVTSSETAGLRKRADARLGVSLQGRQRFKPLAWNTHHARWCVARPEHIPMLTKESLMQRCVLGGALLAGALAASGVMAGENGPGPGPNGESQNFHAVFSGFNELGAIIELKLDPQAQTLTYSLTFSGVTSPVTQAHLHFGKVHDAGGIMVFLCSNLGNGPAGTPACPSSNGTVTGTLSAASVQAIATQNVPAGDFDALVGALESNTVYANIHTQNFPAGEIRGQVERN
jgi:hypothetical protein